MKLYDTPQLQIMEFSDKDVICTSGNNDGFVSGTTANDNDFGWGWGE